MGNRAENFLQSIKTNYHEDLFMQIEEQFSSIEKASTVKQANVIKTGLEILQQEKADIKTIMRPCNCLSKSTIKKAKESYLAANGDMSKFLKLLNDQYIGGGQLRIEGSGKIIGIYSKCFCGIPKAIKEMPSCYCECSAGWYEKLFSAVFERRVDVKIVHTILEGYSECVFEIM